MEAHTNRATNKRTRQVRKFAADNLGRHKDVPIASLRPSMIRDLLEDAAARSLAPSSVKQILATVKAALNTAVKDGILLRSPAEHVAAPRVDSETVTRSSLITAEQIAQVRAHASAQAGLAILVAAATGLRGGEVAGLKVSSIDFLRSTVHVTHQAAGRAKPWTWEPLESARSRREVPLPSSVRDELSRSLIGRDDPEAPLILTRTGGQWSSVTLGEAFKNAAAAANIDAFTFHDLRHFYASVLISRGVSVQGVADLLGHESSVTTLRVYSHLFPGDTDRAREAIDEQVCTICALAPGSQGSERAGKSL